jgi:hypothetical protein
VLASDGANVNRDGQTSRVPVEIRELGHVREVRRLGPCGEEARKFGPVLGDAQRGRRTVVHKLPGRGLQPVRTDQPSRRRKSANDSSCQARFVVAEMNGEAPGRVLATDQKQTNRSAVPPDDRIRQAHGVNGDRIALGQGDEQLGRMWVRKKVLRVNLEPPDRGLGGHRLFDVRQSQADPGRSRSPVNRWHDVAPFPGVLELLGGLAAADDPLAVPFRHEDPRLLVSVALGCATAGVVAGEAQSFLPAFAMP